MSTPSSSCVVVVVFFTLCIGDGLHHGACYFYPNLIWQVNNSVPWMADCHDAVSGALLCLILKRNAQTADLDELLFCFASNELGFEMFTEEAVFYSCVLFCLQQDGGETMYIPGRLLSGVHKSPLTEEGVALTPPARTFPIFLHPHRKWLFLTGH